MHAKFSITAGLVAVAVIVTGVASAGHAAKQQQRIAISSPGGNSGSFVLTPLTSGSIKRGSIKRDSGTATACCWTRRFIRRDGQAIEVDDPLRTFQGKRGTFVWRARIAWVDSGSGYSVGTGTWKIVRGTGAYTHLAGNGRLALVTGANDQGLADRAEGLADLHG
jgi:hypothetical protein